MTPPKLAAQKGRSVVDAVTPSDDNETSRVDDAENVARLVGARVRALRQSQGMIMRELADAAGLKQPFLSQLERGAASPSMLSLYRLAKALGVTPGDLMPDEPESAGAIVIRATDGRRIASTDSENSSAGRLMSAGGRYPLEITEYRIDATQNNDEWFENPSATATFIIEGSLMVEVEGDSTHNLNRGDVIFYPLGARSKWTAEAAHIIHIVVSPGATG